MITPSSEDPEESVLIPRKWWRDGERKALSGESGAWHKVRDGANFAKRNESSSMPEEAKRLIRS